MLDITRDLKKIFKDIKKNNNKSKKYKRNETTAINVFTFTFCIWRTLQFIRKGSLGKGSLNHNI